MINFLKASRDQLACLCGPKSKPDRPAEPAPEPPDPVEPAIRQHMATLGATLRLASDIGCSVEEARSAMVASHRAGLRELIKYNPTLAAKVADGTREMVADALATLDGGQ